MGSRKTIHSKAEDSNPRNRIEDSRGMCSHNKAIHNNRAIPSKIIRNRGMGNNRAILTRDMTNKVTLSRDMVNSKLIRNKAIPDKDMPNSKTISNRVMGNHLPGKTCRPGNCP